MSCAEQQHSSVLPAPLQEDRAAAEQAAAADDAPDTAAAQAAADIAGASAAAGAHAVEEDGPAVEQTTEEADGRVEDPPSAEADVQGVRRRLSVAPERREVRMGVRVVSG